MTSTETSTRPPRILLAKNFLDSHDRAIGTIAIALRDAAMEVIMVEYQVPEDIAFAAIDEDADVIGISFMSGGQVEVTQQLAARLREAGHEQLPVVVGGTIRPFDVPELEKAGVKGIFRGGESLSAIADAFRALARERQEVALG